MSDSIKQNPNNNPTKKQLADRARYLCHKQQGLCVFCKNKPLPNKVYCEVHQRKAAKHRKSRTTRKQKEVANGQCWDCKQPALPNTKYCEKHLLWRREYHRKNSKKNRIIKKKKYRQEREKQKKELGICLNCSAPAVPDRLYCQYHWEKSKEHLQDREERGRARVAAGLCFLCELPLDPTSALYCTSHKDKQKHRANKKNARRIRKLVVQGLCLRCRKPLPESRRDNKRSCDECLKFFANYTAKRRAERLAKGLCSTCGKFPFMDGHTKCENCYFKRISADHFGVVVFGEELRKKFNETGGVCKYTGQKLILGKNVDLDHIVPITKNGPNTIENVQWISFDANQIKRNRTEEEFAEIIRQMAKYWLGIG